MMSEELSIFVSFEHASSFDVTWNYFYIYIYKTENPGTAQNHLCFEYICQTKEKVIIV